MVESRGGAGSATSGTGILFVCHGNICRSTMAQFVMEELVRRAGCQNSFEIDSAATSREELGNDVHPGTRERLRRAGIPCGHHAARQMGPGDYGRFDYIVGMNRDNYDGMYRLLLGERGMGFSWPPVSDQLVHETDPLHKVSLLMDWTGHPRDVADPWYTGNFDTTYNDVMAGCTAMLDKLLAKER
jgi:protein-tyrosine phosphatase